MDVVEIGRVTGTAMYCDRHAWRADHIAIVARVSDFGPARFSGRSGATVIGARELLIAYNVILNIRDKALATDIASELRERGPVARAAAGSAFYSKGKILTYQEKAYPCGNCDFVGQAFEQTIHHCRDQHGYDLAELLRLNEVDPDKPRLAMAGGGPRETIRRSSYGWVCSPEKASQKRRGSYGQ